MRIHIQFADGRNESVLRATQAMVDYYVESYPLGYDAWSGRTVTAVIVENA